MNFTGSSEQWAQETFSGCRLGDPRRNLRLIELTKRLACDPLGSLARICRGDVAAREGAYRLIENKAVRPTDILAGVFESTVKRTTADEVYLAIQDTTDVTFKNEETKHLKEQGNSHGFIAHSNLLVSADSGFPVGLIDQKIWLREAKGVRPGKKTRSSRAFEEKESYKWAESFLRMNQRVCNRGNIITVCDREADIFELLHLYLSENHRFVIRASADRQLAESNERLLETLRHQPTMMTREVTVEQRGAQKLIRGKQAWRPARKGRNATVEIKACAVTLCVPDNIRRSRGLQPLQVNGVLIEEIEAPDGVKPLSWLLLTTEPVGTVDEVEKVADYYRMRWHIEEFHKSWKSGCRLEERRLQNVDNFERMMAICAPVAVRLLQLRSMGKTETPKPCTEILQPEEWQCLHVIAFPDEPIPQTPPDTKWVYYALAKLAGWTDSKRTGRVGWQTLWEGWYRLQFQLDGWRAAMQFLNLNRKMNN
jgi:hypothetical protein